MMDDLQASPLDDLQKRAIENSMRAASNPNAERIDVVIRSLPAERRKLIEKTASKLRGLNADVMARGKAKLDAMSDDDWNDLIERSN